MAKEIKVRVSRLGDTKIDAEGFTGTGCVEAPQAIELALGGGGKRDLKPEYDMPEQTGNSIEQSMRF